MAEKLTLGIIGAGNMGSKHLSNILAGKCPEIEVTAVADRDPAKLEAVHKTLGKARENGADVSDIACFAEGGPYRRTALSAPRTDRGGPARGTARNVRKARGSVYSRRAPHDSRG